jgi:hypothetical protein
MKLTMEAFSQNEKRHPLHMKVIAAPGALAEGDHKCGNNQENNPDAE